MDNRRVIVKVALTAFGTFAFAIVYFLVSYKIDVLIAEWMGDAQNPGNGAWTSLGNIKWTFSSLLGPAIALNTYLFFGFSFFSGFLLSLLLTSVFPQTKLISGNFRRWVLLAVVLTWVLRIPVPLKYSLYYFTAVRY